MKIKKKLATLLMFPAMGMFTILPSFGFADSVYLSGGSSSSTDSSSTYISGSNFVQKQNSPKPEMSRGYQLGTKANQEMNQQSASQKKGSETKNSNKGNKNAKAQDSGSTPSASSSFASNYSLGLDAEVNPQTGQLQMTIDSVKLPGITQNSSVSFGITNQAPTLADSQANGILGFPQGWQPDVAYIAYDNSNPAVQRLYLNGGESYIVDWGYASQDGFVSNLKYLPNKKIMLESLGTSQNITLNNGITVPYYYYLASSDGSVVLFDQGGKQVATIDPYGNAVAYIYSPISPTTGLMAGVSNIKTEDTLQDVSTADVGNAYLAYIVGPYGDPDQAIGLAVTTTNSQSTVRVTMPDTTEWYEYTFNSSTLPTNITLTSYTGRTATINNTYDSSNEPTQTVITYPTGGTATYTYSTYNIAQGGEDIYGVPYMEDTSDMYYFPAVTSVDINPNTSGSTAEPQMTTTYNYNPNVSYNSSNVMQLNDPQTPTELGTNSYSTFGAGANGEVAADCGNYDNTTDWLMDSNSNSYNYYTTVTHSWQSYDYYGNPVTNQLTTLMKFNFLHLPMESQTYFGQGTSLSNITSASLVSDETTLYAGQDSSGDFSAYDSLPCYYNMPSQISTTIYQSPSMAKYLPAKGTASPASITYQTDMTYNGYGNVYTLKKYISTLTDPVETVTYNYDFPSLINSSGLSTSQGMAPYNGIYYTKTATYLDNTSSQQSPSLLESAPETTITETNATPSLANSTYADPASSYNVTFTCGSTTDPTQIYVNGSTTDTLASEAVNGDIPSALTNGATYTFLVKENITSLTGATNISTASSQSNYSYYVPSTTTTFADTGVSSALLAASTPQQRETDIVINSAGQQTSSTYSFGTTSLGASQESQPTSAATSTSYSTPTSLTINGIQYPCVEITQTAPNNTSSSEYADVENGRVMEKVGPSGETETYLYTNSGLTVTTIYSDGTTETEDNSTSPNTVIKTAPNGTTETDTLDGIGRVVASTTTYPGDSSISFTTDNEYNALGKVSEVILPTGRTENTYYDNWHGLPTAQIDELGNEQSIVYDDTGLMSYTYLGTPPTTPPSNSTLMTTTYYNSDWKPIQEVQDSSESTQSVQYNGSDLPVASYLYDTALTGDSAFASTSSIMNSATTYDITGSAAEYQVNTSDAEGETSGSSDYLASSTWTKDLFGQIINRQSVFNYDEPGLNVNIGQPLPCETKYYNNMGQLIELVNPTGETESWTYNNEGDISSFTDFAGNTFVYQYKLIGTNQWVKKFEFMPDKTFLAYKYYTDKGSFDFGNLQSVTRYAKVLNDGKVTGSKFLNEIEYGYQLSGNNLIKTVTYVYFDSNGNKQSKTATYTYEAADTSNTVTAANGGQSSGKQWQVTSITDFAGVTFNYTYYNQSNLPLSDINTITQSYNGNTIASETYTYYTTADGAFYASGSIPKTVTFNNGITIAYSYIDNYATNTQSTTGPNTPELQSIETTNTNTNTIITDSYYVYDSQGREVGLGTYSSLSPGYNSNNYKAYTYNDLGNLTSCIVYDVTYTAPTTTTYPILTQGTIELESYQYVYDANNNLLTEIDTLYDGSDDNVPTSVTCTNYIYNSLDQLQKVSVSTPTTNTLLYACIYDNDSSPGDGNMTALTTYGAAGAGTLEEFTFNDENQLTGFVEYDTTTISSGEQPSVNYSYAYWPDGIRMSKTDNLYPNA